MASPNKRAVLILAITVAAYLVGVRLVGASPATLAIGQLFALPFVFGSLGTLSISGVRIPRIILAAGVIFATCGAVFTYTHVDLAQGAFVVARFADDELEADTKIARDRIRRAVASSDRSLGATEVASLVGSHAKSLNSSADAQSVLSRHEQLGGVVWGSKRWINVSLRRYSPVALSSFTKESVYGRYRAEGSVPDLQLVTSVSSIGISDSSDAVTLQFLGGLVTAWRSYGRAVQAVQEQPDLDLNIRTLSSLKAHWTAFSHRALPMWMAGTYHIIVAGAGRDFQGGDLACAFNAFEAASAQLRPGDNPELQAALLNNRAVALVIRAATSSNPRGLRMLAKQLLKQGVVALEGSQHGKARKHSETLSVLTRNLSLFKKKNDTQTRRKI